MAGRTVGRRPSRFRGGRAARLPSPTRSIIRQILCAGSAAEWRHLTSVPYCTDAIGHRLSDAQSKKLYRSIKRGKNAATYTRKQQTIVRLTQLPGILHRQVQRSADKRHLSEAGRVWLNAKAPSAPPLPAPPAASFTFRSAGNESRRRAGRGDSGTRRRARSRAVLPAADFTAEAGRSRGAWGKCGANLEGFFPAKASNGVLLRCRLNN